MVECLVLSGRPFQHNLMFASKARAYLSEVRTFQVLHSRVSSWPYTVTLDLAGEACQELDLKHIWPIRKLQK